MPAKKVGTSKRPSRPSTKSSDTPRIAIQNVNVPGRSTRVDAAKYEAMRSVVYTQRDQSCGPKASQAVAKSVILRRPIQRG